MTETGELRPGMVFRSNHGRGPMMARIVGLEANTVYLVRWRSVTGKREVPFKLTRKFFASPRCGWKCTLRYPRPSAESEARDGG